jgi:hypothetical protein
LTAFSLQVFGSPPIEAALLRLFRVKQQLLDLHPFNQLFNAVNGWLICDPRRQHAVMLDFPVKLDALSTHNRRLKSRRQATGRLYLMTTESLFCSKLRSILYWFRNHAAFVYLMGDGSGLLLGYRAYQSEAAPKLYTVAMCENLGLGEGLFIVGTHKRLVPIEVTVIAYSVSAVVRHYRGACKPGDVSHCCMCAAVSACRARRMSLSRSIPGGVPLASLRRRFACSSRR